MLAPEADTIVIELKLDPIELAIEQAVPCGLILNELLTNAFKYAFRAMDDGRIVVSHSAKPRAVPMNLRWKMTVLGLAAGRERRQFSRAAHRGSADAPTGRRSSACETCAGTRMVLRFPAGNPACDNSPQCAHLSARLGRLFPGGILFVVCRRRIGPGSRVTT